MKKSPIENGQLAEYLKKMEDDSKAVYLLSGGQARLTVVSSTHIVNQMKANHRLGLLETYILGQAYTAGLLLTSTIKGNDRVILTIECGGPVKGLSVEAWACGAVRGYLLQNPIPLTEELKNLDTSMLFGPGFITVSRLLEGSKEPVSGTVMMQYGNIAKDLAVYFDESEQTPTLFYISLQFDSKAEVTGAGGLFIQAMPGCSDETLASLSSKASALSNLGRAVSEGKTVSDYIEAEFAAFSPEKLSESFVAFSCPCTREHFQSYLSKLPQKEKDEILAGTFPLELECFNCGTVYSFTKSEVEALFEKEKDR